MALARPGRIAVGATTARLLQEPDYESWDDDELIRGQRRNKNGTWAGRNPKVIPLALLFELNKRVASRGAKKLMAGLEDAIDYLVGVANGTQPPDKDRQKAAEFVITRCLGATPQKVELKTIEKSVWEREGVTKAIVVRDVIDVDSEEEWTNPFEEEP